MHWRCSADTGVRPRGVSDGPRWAVSVAAFRGVMMMLKSCAAIALTLLLAACGDRPAEARAQTVPSSRTPATGRAAPVTAPAASPAGEYAMSGPRVGTLELRDPGNGEWTVRLQGGGAPIEGAAMVADCELHARGALEGDRIEANVVPFDSTLMSVTTADLQRRPSAVTVTLEGGAAIVDTDFALCAMQADLNGRYVRRAAR